MVLEAALLLIVGSIAPNSSVARMGPAPILDPRRYTSPSGRYALDVDPSHPQGRGAAKYRLTHEGEELWSGEKPYTYWSAVVTDEGTSVGYAYPKGIHSNGKEAFVVILLDVRGRELARHAWQRVRLGPEGPWRPEGAGIHFDDDSAHRVVVRVRDASERHDFAESLWRFRIDDGGFEGESPAPLGAEFPKTRVDSPPTAAKSRLVDPTPLLRPIALREISRTTLGTPTIVMDESDAEPILNYVDEALIDRRGRVVTLYRGRKWLQIFEPSGVEIGRNRLGAEDELGMPFVPALIDPGDGDFLVRVANRRFVRIDRTGRRIGLDEDFSGSNVSHYAFQPNASRRWVVRDHKPEVVEVEMTPDGPRSRTRIDRRPDGKWLRRILAMSATEDGTLFVQDASSASLVPVPEAICVYPPQGDPGLVLELPGYVPMAASSGAAPPPVQVQGKLVGVTPDWIVLAFKADVYLLDREGKQFLRVDLGPIGNAEPRATCAPSPDGRELWRFERWARTLVRYALP